MGFGITFLRHRIPVISLAITLALTLIGCGKSGSEETASGAGAAPATSPAVANPRATFTASPNPTIATAEKLGKTSLNWSTTATQRAEVRVGKPDGTLMCAGLAAGSCTTGQWVTDGMTFYLQDSTAAKPTDPAATLAAVTVRVQ